MGTPIDQLRQTIIANDTHKGKKDKNPKAKILLNDLRLQLIQPVSTFGSLGVKLVVMADMLCICLTGSKSILHALLVIVHVNARYKDLFQIKIIKMIDYCIKLFMPKTS